MSNTAYTTFIVTGDRTQIDRLLATFDRLEQTPVSPEIEDNGWDSHWLGCLVRDLGGNTDEIYCRGYWTEAYFDNSKDYMVIEIETAWRVPDGIRKLLESSFPGIKIWYYTTLEDSDATATNDEEGKYFHPLQNNRGKDELQQECGVIVHLVDKKGNKVEMLYSEWLKIQNSINDSNERYEADTEWYLAHGTEANEAFRNIEQQEFDDFYNSEDELTEGDFVSSEEILLNLRKKL